MTWTPGKAGTPDDGGRGIGSGSGDPLDSLRDRRSLFTKRQPSSAPDSFDNGSSPEVSVRQRTRAWDPGHACSLVGVVAAGAVIAKNGNAGVQVCVCACV